MIRLLHLADVHLGGRFSEFGGLATVRREVHLAAFRRLPTVAADHPSSAALPPFAGKCTLRHSAAFPPWPLTTMHRPS